MTILRQAISLLRFKLFHPIPPAGDIDADPFVRNSSRDRNDRGIARPFIDGIGAIHAGSAQARPRFAPATGCAFPARRFLP
jgi:hypothetical protein